MKEMSRWLFLLFCFSVSACLAAIYLERAIDDKQNGGVVITEICSQNSICAYDENGEYGADYIELYNSTDNPINLSQYALSDKETNLKRFVFGDVTIGPHKALVVWNNYDINGTEFLRDDYVPRDIHGLPFSLKPGETVYLSNADGVVVQKVFIKQVESGMVLASTNSNLSDFRESEPSPYLLESVYSASNSLDYIPSPEFSTPGGWYKESIDVSLNTAYGTIYYTLDGSEPDENSELYTKPFSVVDRSQEENIYSAFNNISLINPYLPDYPVDKGTVVKAISIDGNGNRSEVVSQTYFVGLDDDDSYNNISVMEITMDPDDLFDSKKGIYVLGDVYENYLKKYDSKQKAPDPYFDANYAKEGRGWERKAHINYYDKSHNMVLEQDVGIRIHGGWSVSFNQKSFNIYSRTEYDGNEFFKYDFFGKKYNKIMLRSGGCRDTYCTKLRDVFNQSLVEDRAIGTERGEPCVVFLNGEYWGLYNLQETIGTSYIEENYGIDPDNVIIIKNNTPNTNAGDKASWDNIISYADENDLSISKNYKYISDRIDIQSYIDYFCYQIYIANCDCFDNNHARWRSRTVSTKTYEDGKWRWILYDTDDSVGIVMPRTSYDVDSFVEGHWFIDPLGERRDILFSALIENQEFKDLFVSSFLEMANSNFRYDNVAVKLGEIAETYEKAVVKSHERFLGDFVNTEYPYQPIDGQYTAESFRNDISVIDEFYKNRADYIIPFMYKDLN